MSSLSLLRAAVLPARQVHPSLHPASLFRSLKAMRPYYPARFHSATEVLICGDPGFPPFHSCSEPVLCDWVESRPQTALPSTPPADLSRPASVVSRNEVVNINEVKAIVIHMLADYPKLDRAMEALRARDELARLKEAFEEVRGLRAFATICLQRVVALARFHQLIDPAAALRFTSMVMAETCADYSATHLEVPGMPDFDPAVYEAQQQTGIHFCDLYKVHSEVRDFCAQQVGDEGKEPGKATHSGYQRDTNLIGPAVKSGEIIVFFSLPKPVPSTY
ncbi:hypothetical protein B0H17DRAFT_1151246 [Mycena rosella]|uniref:Uncharacterized protein n=1 Tax=Mycena rosella TaxID=1033263 RepID=A0AAD7BMF4_MYCRO|nr:hypothetical protein B0H17DRAFT_1151246 [Mycena rosella]